MNGNILKKGSKKKTGNTNIVIRHKINSISQLDLNISKSIDSFHITFKGGSGSGQLRSFFIDNKYLEMIDNFNLYFFYKSDTIVVNLERLKK